MATLESSSEKSETNSTADNSTRSIADRLSIGPLLSAGRLIPCLSKPTRLTTSKRNYTITSIQTEKNFLFKPLFKQMSTNRSRSASPADSISSTTSLRNSKTTPSNLNEISKNSTQSPPSTPMPDTIGINFNYKSTYVQLRELAEVNSTYFSQQKTDVCQRFERLLLHLIQSIDASMPMIDILTNNCHHFDYSSEIPANGYRTLAVAHGQAASQTLEILRQVDTKRVGLLFNLMYSSRLFQDLESWTKTLAAMQHILSLAAKMIDYSEKKSLYVDADHVPLDVELDYFRMVAFDSEHYFGRTCGFQFAPSMQTMLTFLLAGLATYYETYNRSIPYAAASLASAPKYILFPEQRAKKCAAIFRDSDYLFCKSFWNLVDHDYVKMGSRYIAPNVTVSKYFQIGPEPIVLGSVSILPPTAKSKDGTQALVNIKLLSNEIRDGMQELPLRKGDLETSSNAVLPMSDQLLMHIHGGGFIATSSTTHEVYLKPWALGLEIPIVSVDYSLAPEYPFPHAIEECFYAYAWILKNASKLGWNGKTLLLAGDSAGGNLVTIVTIKAIEAGLRRPDAIICFYTPFLLGYSMSPSRLMAIMDPLLNTGFLWRCLAAYAGIKADDESHSETNGSSQNLSGEQSATTESNNSSMNSNERSSRGDIYYARLAEIMGKRQALLLRKLRESTLPEHPYMSPLRASDEILRKFPTTYLIPCARDPFIDDNVEFARRLRQLNVEHELFVVDEWPHGFLDFGMASIDVAQCNQQMIQKLQQIVKQTLSEVD